MKRLSKVWVILFLIGTINAFKDGISTHYVYFKSKLPFISDAYFNPNISWENKWKNKEIGVEAFWQSSRLLVFITDAWHLCNFVMTWLIAALVAYCLNKKELLPNNAYIIIFYVVIAKVSLICGYFLTWTLLFN